MKELKNKNGRLEIHDKGFSPVTRSVETPELHGHVKLILKDINTGEEEIRESSNTVTTFPQKAVNEGNFQYTMRQSKILPIANFFKGCILTNQVEDDTGFVMDSASDVIAQASNDAYTDAGNPRRGSMDNSANGTKPITGGYQYVWTWGANQGNGTNISSICLCRPTSGATFYSASSSPLNTEGFFEMMGDVQSSDVDTNLVRATVIDYENETAYLVEYSTGVITITEYNVNTYRLHQNGGPFSVGLRKGTPHTINQTIDNYSLQTTSVSYDGSYLHILAFANESDTIKDYKVDITDLDSVSVESHTWAGASFSRFEGASYLQRDMMPIVNGFLYAYSNNNTKILKCDMSSAAVVDNDLPTALQSRTYNGPTVIFSNGDFVKIPSQSMMLNHYCLYFHHGEYYIANVGLTDSQIGWEGFITAIEANTYGTVIYRAYRGSGGDNEPKVVGVLCPFSYVSTVYEVNPPVDKTSSKSMQLIYTITES